MQLQPTGEANSARFRLEPLSRGTGAAWVAGVALSARANSATTVAVSKARGMCIERFSNHGADCGAIDIPVDIPYPNREGGGSKEAIGPCTPA